MDKYYKTQDVPLEPQELAKLKRGFWVIPVFLIIFIGFFVFIFQVVTPVDGPIFWIPVVMSVFFAGLMGYIIWGFVMDLSLGTKQVFQGLITKKDVHHGAGKSKSRTYYLFFGEKRMRVEPHIYHKFEEGDLIELHRSKRLYNMIYKTELLKREVVMQVVAEAQQQRMSRQQRIGFILISLFVLTIGMFVAAVLLGWVEW